MQLITVYNVGRAVKNNNIESAVGMAIWEGFRMQICTLSSMLCYAYIITYVKNFFCDGFMLLMSWFLDFTHVTFVFPYVLLKCILDLKAFSKYFNISTF